MPRVHGVRERRDKTFYDTHSIHAGRERVRFFGNKNIGDYFLTNMHVGNQLAQEQTYVCLGIGMRLIGEPREQEDLLLDHLLVTVIVGDKPQWDGIGPHLSMLRQYYTKEEIESRAAAIEKFTDEERIGLGIPPANRPPCYLFAAPIVIPVRQRFEVTVEPSDYLPRSVVARVHLFGLQTRDVP